MWQRLEKDVLMMAEHLLAQIKETQEFTATLEPIFKYVYLKTIPTLVLEAYIRCANPIFPCC
jgi:hypothetical protein